MSGMRILIVSDTHRRDGNFRRVLEKTGPIDMLIHLGDTEGSESYFREWVDNDVCVIHVVRGNNDKAWAEDIPHDLTVTLEGVTFYMVHNKKELPADLDGVDVVVFGHSHKYVQEEKDGILWLNPGSCGPRRFHQEITMIMAEIEDGKIRVEKIVIPQEVK